MNQLSDVCEGYDIGEGGRGGYDVYEWSELLMVWKGEGWAGWPGPQTNHWMCVADMTVVRRGGGGYDIYEWSEL